MRRLFCRALYNGRDKTFFFSSYEGLYVPQPTPQTYPYGPSFDYLQPPPAAVLTGAVLFPRGSPELNDSSGNPSGLGSSSIAPLALPAHLNSISIRVDHSFSSKFAMFFRYGDAPSYSETQQLDSFNTNRLGSRTFSFGTNSQVIRESQQ